MQDVLYDLRVSHTRTNPVIVLGHPRSGTTILVKLLRKYLKVNFGTESQFIVRYQRRLHRFGDLSRPENLRSLVERIAKERCFERTKKRFGFELDTEQVLRDAKQPTLRGVLDAIYSQFAGYHSMERWGDKSPEYNHDLPALYEVFPDAQYLHIVRDGRDVELSIFREFFGPKNVTMGALSWRNQLEKIEELAADLGPGQFHELRYEDLLREPLREFDRLIDYLGIDDSSGELREFLAERLPTDIRAGNMEKWRTQLTKAQLRRFEQVAHEQLRAHGYETLCESPRPLSPLELGFARVDDFVRRHADRRHWRDHLYRMKLRLRLF